MTRLVDFVSLVAALVLSAALAAAPAAASVASHVTAPSKVVGAVVVLDPGHDGGNGSHASLISRRVWAGSAWKACDTAGAQTAQGYAEHAYTFDVARRAAALLRARGVVVVLTRSTDTGVGPCITERAAIGNQVHAAAAVSLHADGGPTSGYGFHVIEPTGVGPSKAVVLSSLALGSALRTSFRAATGESYSTYAGRAGLIRRGDLGGLNLSHVPKVFIECANMANRADAARLSSPAWRQAAAKGVTDGILAFLARS